MAPYTHENHLRFGYEGRSSILRASENDKFFIKFGQCRLRPGSFRQECLRAASLIQESTSLDIHVCLSGGIDSELILRAFHAAGIRVQAAILRFHDFLNIHDISWAVLACQELGIEYRFYDLDLLEFWEGPLFDFCRSTQCLSPQLGTGSWLVDQIDGYPVRGNCDTVLQLSGLPENEKLTELFVPTDHVGVWQDVRKERFMETFRRLIVNRREGCPSFFLYTPELIAAYLLDPEIRLLCEDNPFRRATNLQSRFAVYQKLVPQR